LVGSSLVASSTMAAAIALGWRDLRSAPASALGLADPGRSRTFVANRCRRLAAPRGSAIRVLGLLAQSSYMRWSYSKPTRLRVGIIGPDDLVDVSAVNAEHLRDHSQACAGIVGASDSSVAPALRCLLLSDRGL
jgi:hypothetical protein